MSNVIQMTRQPAPSEAVATEFGHAIFFARKDPSDPDTCERYLLDRYPDRWREILANRERAMDIAGQLYLDKVSAAVSAEVD
jgi:hypothetical protein